ncbi:hypothetical protein LQ938_11025 [Microbacterium sp. cx-55]|uniref:hypothetical protein n=1 Tax=unclassified Microbacterium TaxID=2609290 RepID=UPI001CBC20B4|nr:MULTISPECIES: hypothetical protein [unclassified Microbacterium]MBZ4488190.1 hypothetical protein [Microbacterium sp. cx-55]MCC4908803.1 hypothetical protein [Microbacterium sp. cx-59]UGB34403.1 hypothetical protein LQ938_11025 [Microbacterium sp. cx-55]
MSIQVKMPGSPESVRAVADWLDSVKSSMTDTDVELTAVWSDSNYYWTGESGSSWRDTVGTVRSRAMGVPGFLGDATEVFRAYANRLERAQEDFETLLFQAGEVGLQVVGDTVFPPTTNLQYCPAPGAPAEDLEEYEDYTDKVASYNDLGTQVGTTMGQLDVWIGENIVPLVERVEELRELSGTVDALSAPGNDDLAGAVLDGYDRFNSDTLGEWRTQHDTLQDSAETFRNQLRSGNPAVRAAAEAADPRAMAAGAEEIAEQIGRVSRFAKVIPVAGTVLEVVSIASDVADGGSLSSGVAEAAGGAAGGLAGGAAAGGIAVALGSNPVGWVIGGVVVGGIAVGSGARWLWEAAVPLDSRETIDDFFTGGPPRLEGYTPPSPRSRPVPGG